MHIVAGVAEFQPIAPPFMHGIFGLHGLHGKGLAVECPAVEAVDGAILIRKWNSISLPTIRG
jgi:hypothetical protein